MGLSLGDASFLRRSGGAGDRSASPNTPAVTGDASGADRGSAAGRLLAVALGVAAFAIAFGVAVTVGRALSGGTDGPFLVPFAVSGALALGLGVGSVVSTAVAQPDGVARAARVLTVVAPFATLIAFFAYSSDPAATVRVPFAGSPPSSAPLATRSVSPTDPILVAPDPGTPPEATPPRTSGDPVARPVSRPFVGPVAPEPAQPVAVPAGPVVRPRPVAGLAPIGPTIVGEPVTPPAEKSYRPGSSGCRARSHGLGRSQPKPRPRTCRKK